MSEPRELDEVRRELQRRGYLSHGVERFLLQDALLPRPSGRATVRLAARFGLLAGILLAAASALALALVNGALPQEPYDPLILFAHLLVPAAGAAGLGFLLLLGTFALALRAFPRRSADALRVGTALAVATLGAAASVSLGWDLLVALPRWQRTLALALVPLVAAALARLLADALLAFFVRFTRRAPREPRLSRRVIAGVLAGSVAVLGLAALAWPLRGTPTPPVSLPSAPGERVALIGVDGVLPAELDFLLARGELPTLGRAGDGGGLVASYRRPAAASPAELWTTIATGHEAARHGVVALDSFRPLGMATALARSGPWRPWLAAVEHPLGFAEYRPLLASRRRAFTFWELAARGGAPVAAIDWWATFPAEPLPGLVVAHGAFAMLRAGEGGAVEPPGRRAELAAQARVEAAAPAAAVLAALPPALGEELTARALAPDRFYRELAAAEAAAGARAVAVYLPALDLAAHGWPAGAQAWAELVGAELGEIDALAARLGETAGTVVVVLDPGRRGGDEGRLLMLRAGCAGRLAAVEPAQVAPALLRALGLPQSAELPEPPEGCRWGAPPARVPSFGERARRPLGGDPAEYLENLRALGYL